MTTPDSSPEADQYTVEIEGDSYAVVARDDLDARYRAASRHKTTDDGPDVVSVDEFARIATITASP